jgi:multiple sugar transport system ATP-binding protein
MGDERVDVELAGGYRAAVRCRPSAHAGEGAPVTLGVRPEALNAEGAGDSRLPGKIYAVERLGGETYVYLNMPEGGEMTVHTPGDKMLAMGDDVTVGFNADKCHLFDADGTSFERLENSAS